MDQVELTLDNGFILFEDLASHSISLPQAWCPAGSTWVVRCTLCCAVAFDGTPTSCLSYTLIVTNKLYEIPLRIGEV